MVNVDVTLDFINASQCHAMALVNLVTSTNDYRLS